MDQQDERQESERAAALKRYQILDSEPEPTLDRLTRLAASLFDTPMAAITFAADGHTWSKSTVGLDSPEHIGKSGFFDHAIEDDETLVVGDATADQRFADDPLVTSAPHIRFYAGAPLITPDGQRIGTLSIADPSPRKDVSATDTDRLQDLASLVIDQLELRRQRLGPGRAMENSSAIFAAMSHEIRTPMSGVLGMAELLLMADDLNDRHRRRVKIIKQSGGMLLSMLDHLIELSKIETEEYAPDISPFDLLETARDVHSEFKSKDIGKAIELNLMSGCLDVIGDAPRFKELFSHFLNCAVTNWKEGPICIVMAANSANDGKAQVRFEVKNATIATDTIRQMLAKLERGDHMSLNGFGEAYLSLNICKKLSLMMGGDIGVHHLAGEDPVFWLDISLIAQAGPVASKQILTAPVSAKAQRFAGTVRDVLVAEDNPDMAFLIEDLLEEAGYHATIAADGASVLKILDHQHFDVVLMDGQMPDMSGLETADLIRKLPDERANVPIIALTAEALVGDRERYLSAGMDDYVAKPVDYETLVGAIERCCNTQQR